MRKFYGRTLAAIALIASSLTLADRAWAGSLISVDMQGQGGANQPFSGVDPIAAAANSVFGNADQWNHLAAPDYDQAAQNAVTFAGLKDSTGATTAVNFTVTGGIKSYSLFGQPGFNDPLRNDYWFFNSNNYNPVSTLNWNLAGLMPATRYRFFAFGSRSDASPDRQFSLLADSDGDGSLANETAQVVTADGLLLTLKTDVNGVLLGQSIGMGGMDFNEEANWSGFQIAEAPRSAPTPALLPGLVGMGIAAWKKRRSV